MSFKTLFKSVLSGVVLAGAVVGCGGGSTGISAPSSVGIAAEGLWKGSTSDGYSLTALVLENGELWALGSSNSGVVGFVHGTLTETIGNSLYGSETTYGLLTHMTTSESFTGTVSPKNTLNLVAGSTTYNASYASGYEQSPTPFASMAGTYSGWVATVSGSYDPAAVTTITSTGQISAAGTTCSVLGNLSYRASGKNVYNVNITYNGGGCPIAGTTLSGVVAYDATSGVLVVLALNGAKTDGLVYSAKKQVSSNASYPLRSGYQALLSQNHSYSYTISGTCIGSATETTSAAVAASFEGVNGNSTTTTISGTYANCTPASFASTSTNYYDANLRPLGGSGSDYWVFTNAQDLPEVVSIGDTAQFGTINVYSSSAKTVRTGSRTISYVVEPDTATTAIINVIAKGYNATNQLLYTQQTRSRIDTSGQMTPVSIDIQYSTTSNTHMLWTRN